MKSLKGSNGRNKTVTITNGENSNHCRTNQIIHTVMIIGVITGGMIIGYLVGMYIVDRYINTNHEDIDREPKD